MLSPTVLPVLVAGAGPSGLAAALTLLQNGVPVRIIEKASQYHPGQRAVGIWPRTFEAFHFLRAHEVYERSTLFPTVKEYKAGALEPSKTFVMFSREDPTPTVPYTPKVIGQPTTEAVLRSHIEKYNCHVELGTELQSFEDDGERVIAKLIKSKEGEETLETCEVSYLIGADGAKGVTRKQLGLSFLGKTRDDFCSVIGDICLSAEGIDRQHTHMFGDRHSSFLMLRPANDLAMDGFQFVMTVKGYEPKELVADQELMFKHIAELTGRDINVRELVTAADYRPNIRMVDRFGVGRVFVAGDAAHVHSPTGGQGLNTSVQDALNIAWKLSLVYKGLAPVTLLDSYTAERLPVVAEMLDITTGVLNRVINMPSLEGAMTRERRLNMLGVNYRTSSIVRDEFTTAGPVSAYGTLDEGVLVAGDRAPEAPGLVSVPEALQTRLFDIFGATYHTILVFAPDTASSTDIVEALKRYDADLIRVVVVLPQGSEALVTTETDTRVNVVIDRDGYAYRAYLVAAGERRVVVVRPDGVAGAIIHGGEGVKTYFSNIFV